jgi:hypothetical protein
MITLFLLFVALLILGITACRRELIVLTGSKALSGNDVRIGLAFISSVADAV